MQFHQAHTMRRQIIDVLRGDMPDILDALIGAGATIATTADNRPTALHCRRMLFDRVLRSAAEAQGIKVVTGHVDEVLRERGRAVGGRVDGRSQPAELVIDASGRANRFSRAVRRQVEGADCGATYVSRQYQLRPDATWVRSTRRPVWRRACPATREIAAIDLGGVVRCCSPLVHGAHASHSSWICSNSEYVEVMNGG
jgi:hypothetical protein